MSKTSTLHKYARMGATARIKELQEEIDAIRRAFPDIDGAAPKRRRPGRPRATNTTSEADPEPAASTPKRGNRKPMTAAQKRAVGIRMKKYWSERRKAAKAKSA